MVDLNDFQLTKGDKLVGGSWELIVEHCRDEDLSLQFALPAFTVSDQGLDIQTASKNGFYRAQLNLGDPKQDEFKLWIEKVETWLVSQMVNNHESWFGYMWEKDGPLAGHPRPTAAKIQNMYHPIIDEDNLFCARVHVRKGEYECQCMDSDQNEISLASIKNCLVVPLVELKGVFMKPRGYNPDIVLRGLVAISPNESTENNEYSLFHSPEDEEHFAYVDYATDDDDDTDDDESVDETLELEEQTAAPVPVAPPVVTEEAAPTTTEAAEAFAAPPIPPGVDQETLQRLMRATEDARAAAKNAEDVYNQYMGTQSS